MTDTPDNVHTHNTHTDNLRFYNMGANVPKEATKEFNNGRFKGTDINRMWRIKALTEMFGPAGFGWSFNLVDIQERKLDNSDGVVLFAKGELKVRDPDTKEWSEPIVGYGGNFLVQSFSSGTRLNDEAYKMVETDAFGAACSKLGIGASVYWNEATKYTQKTEEPKTVKTGHTPDPFFTKKKAEGPSTEKSASHSDPDPSTADFFKSYYAIKDGRVKAALQQYMTDRGIMSPYETTPAQRTEMSEIIKGVA